MSEQFELFRVSLIPRHQPSLFADMNASREQWLRHIFSDSLEFSGHNNHYIYIPETVDLDTKTDDQFGTSKVIFGKIGRYVNREINKPPEEHFDQTITGYWRAALLLLDPTAHEDGQKIALQALPEVGKPRALLKRLCSQVNEMPEAPFHMEIGEIIDEEGFWAFVNYYDGEITRLGFNFVVPNMFGSDEEFDAELREFRDSENAETLQMSISNADYVEPKTDRIHRAVRYASNSGGKITAKSRTGETFNSTREVKRTSAADAYEEGETLLNRVIRSIARVLGRE